MLHQSQAALKMCGKNSAILKAVPELFTRSQAVNSMTTLPYITADMQTDRQTTAGRNTVALHKGNQQYGRLKWQKCLKHSTVLINYHCHTHCGRSIGVRINTA